MTRLERAIEGERAGVDWERVGPAIAAAIVAAVFVALMLTIGQPAHVTDFGCTETVCEVAR